MAIRYRTKKIRSRKYTEQLVVYLEPKTMAEFRAIAGTGCSTKTRELIQMYIDAYNRKKNERDRTGY